MPLSDLDVQAGFQNDFRDRFLEDADAGDEERCQAIREAEEVQRQLDAPSAG